jgi:hypothetical protein
MPPSGKNTNGLTLAKQHLGATPSTRTSLPLTDITGGADLK